MTDPYGPQRYAECSCYPILNSSDRFTAIQHAAVSPCGTYVASLTPHNLSIQSATTLLPAYTFPLTPKQLPDPSVVTIQWASSSTHIILLSAQALHIFSLASPDLKINLTNGSSALGRILAADILAHNSRTPSALVFWEFGRTTLWDLTSGRATELGDAKTTSRGHPWALRASAPGRPEVLALLLRQNAQDVMNLYTPPSTAPIRSVTLPTADALALSWSADGKWLGVFDSFLGAQQCHVYTPEGLAFRQFPPAKQTTEGVGLGYKSLTWTRQHVVLTEAQTLTFLNTRLFALDFTVGLGSIKTESTSLEEGVEAYQEVINAANQRSYTTLTGQLIPVPTAKSSIIDVQSNASGFFVSCRDSGSTGALYLFNIAKRKIHSVLLQYVAIRKASWHPTRETIIIVLGEDGVVYVWDIVSGQGPMPIPHGFDNVADTKSIEARWIGQKANATAADGPKLAIFVSTRKAGFQVIWPEGQPSADDAGRAAGAGTGPDVDASEDSLYDILTGRTPLPELKVRQVEEEVAAEETERLDDTFREKRGQVHARSQEPSGGVEDDSEIF